MKPIPVSLEAWTELQRRATALERDVARLKDRNDFLENQLELATRENIARASREQRAAARAGDSLFRNGG